MNKVAAAGWPLRHGIDCELVNCRFQFQKSRQYFLRVDDETLSVAHARLLSRSFARRNSALLFSTYSARLRIRLFEFGGYFRHGFEEAALRYHLTGPLTTRQLAAHLGVTERTLAPWRRNGRIPFWPINSLCVRYNLAAVERALMKPKMFYSE